MAVTLVCLFHVDLSVLCVVEQLAGRAGSPIKQGELRRSEGCRLLIISLFRL